MPASGGGAVDHVTVSVLVVTHNNERVIARCLDSILGGRPRRAMEVIVVDNASTDGTVDLIKRGGWPVALIELTRNVGFAGAVNRAWQQARGRYVALVNSDAFPDPGCLDRLVDTLERHPRAALAGARLRYPSGRLQPSAGTFPSLRGDLWVALLLHRAPGLSRLGVGYYASPSLYRRARPVDWVSAAVCAARAETGPLPESSFMYGEDVLWASRCREDGLEVWLEPTATAVHVSRASVDQSREPGFAQRQRARFELGWFAPRGAAVLIGARAVLLIHALLRLVVYAAAAGPRSLRDVRVREYATLAREALAPRRAA